MSLVCAAFGLSAYLLLPFATVRHSRIATGVSVWAARALPPAQFACALALWLAIVALAFARTSRGVSVARGLLGSGVIVGLLALSGYAASRLGPGVGPYARVSIGSGVWVSDIAAYAVVLSSRRELGRGTMWARVVGLVAPLGIVALIASGILHDTGIAKEYANVSERFLTETINTIVYSGVSVIIATVIGVALGVIAYRRPRTERPIFSAVSVFQTVPGIAMVGLLVAPLAALSFSLPWLRSIGFGGLGWAPVIIALTLYALLAIVRNTHAGLRGVDRLAVDAGRGMGMTSRQLLRGVEIPLGMPVVFSGVRTSAVQTFGNSTIGAFVGGVTLGRFIFQGLAEQAPDLTMLGALALVAISLIVDGMLREAQRVASRAGTHAQPLAERTGP